MDLSPGSARLVRGEKVILDDLTLSFLPAKIGVVGPNGAGKSTRCGSWPDWNSHPTEKRA